MANQVERVGTVERETAVALLGDALAGGYLEADEFTERSAVAYAARTRGELEALVADLPQGFMRARARERRRLRAARGARLGMWAHVASYVGGSLLMIGIWAAVGLGTGAWYFWPVWPILGWGVGLLGHVIPVRAVLSRHTPRTQL
ncbi:DUF1707 domain-containing protein [Phytohabitans aurantiacus]|uniref:2TM domain-containing protein n=1 Tax=Phytohabitans aurantiacus TaxID=3016789 RepID=A0ABQ5QK50_9ACTN|nr:DUF1707 domain-containing protein [Phytohabitans aurantiacus]GLH94943.1 hypothetical protein Pa4123_02150 [Phytohabitans aurantiacus]